MFWIEWIVLKIVNKILSNIKISINIIRRYNDMYHKLIFNRLLPIFKLAHRMSKSGCNYKNSKIIWMFWFQGKKHMPLIVSSCINSIVKNSGNHRVILISKYNIRKYSTMPNYIYIKMKNGNISLAHFADILRFNLLYNYGGLWIDSTIYCASSIDNKCFSNIYTCGGYQNYDHHFISTKWSSFLIGGNKCNKLFSFMNNFFCIYWKYNNYSIDYFLMDYALSYAYKHNIGNFNVYTNKIACKNNPNLYELNRLINHKFDKGLYRRICTHTSFFKLTYKQRFNNMNNTFYSKIVSR